MHVGPDTRKGGGKTARQSTQGVVPQPRIGQRQRRHGDISFEKTAAELYRAACLRLFPRLSMPRATAKHASTSDRHRSLQVRVIQTERIDQARTQFQLLEAGTPLSRRYRMDDSS